MKNDGIKGVDCFEYDSKKIYFPLTPLKMIPHSESNIKYSCRIWDLLKVLLKIFILRGNISIVLDDGNKTISGIKVIEYHKTIGTVRGFMAYIFSI